MLQETHHVADAVRDPTDSTTYNLFAVTEQPTAVPPLMVEIEVNQTRLHMEIGTGATVSIISMDTYTKLWPTEQRPKLEPSARKLRTYTGEELDVKGNLTVDITYSTRQIQGIRLV